MDKVKLKIIQPWIAYPGSTIQQNYAEELSHGYLLWDIKSKDSFTTQYIELENIIPFQTITWNGDKKYFIKSVSNLKQKSRVRIISDEYVSQNDITFIKKYLKENISATEIVFKINKKSEHKLSDIVIDGKSMQKHDLHSSKTILELLKIFAGENKNFNIIESDWEYINTCLNSYISELNIENQPNKVWEINSIKFTNLYSYGDGNYINFDKLNGLVGILGPNRVGKSSIVASLLYSLFNCSDRGSIKNINMVNCRKSYGEATAIITVDGKQYLIERKTIKHESKKGILTAPTTVNIFEYNPQTNERFEISGEQRNDTDKFIRGLIGNNETFLLTTLSAQNDTNRFINEGSTHRKLILTKFLGLDIFEKLSELSKRELNVSKSRLKEYNINSLENEKNELILKIESENLRLNSIENTIIAGNNKLEEFRNALSKFDIQKQEQYKKIELDIQNLNLQKQRLTTEFENLKIKIINTKNELNSAKEIQINFDIESNNKLELSLKLQKEISDVKKQLEILNIKKLKMLDSIKILSQVPCGDSFPTCMFIKNAYTDKINFENIVLEIEDLGNKLSTLESEYENYEPEKLKKNNKIAKEISNKIERLMVDGGRLENEYNNSKQNLSRISNDIEIKILEKLNMLNSFGYDEEIIYSIFSKADELKIKFDRLNSMLQEKGKEKIQSSVTLGILNEKLLSLEKNINSYNNLLDKFKNDEFLNYAFSKNGISAKIIQSQLPVINSEIQNILQGVVDFNVELSMEEDSMEVYINYGDSKRIIELCSGMEKFISSMAIRVALTSVSTLPKTNIFVIDEGFGTLDEQGIDACNRLLLSLRKYFKSIFIITHVESVKEIVDNIVDISKIENDSKVYVS